MNTPARWASLAVLAVCAAGCATTPPPSPAPSGASSRDLFAAQAKSGNGTMLPVVSAADGVTRGDEAWRAGNLDLALYLFVQGLQFDQRNATLLSKIGSIHEHRGNMALAARAFELARERDPDDPRLMERLGLVYLAGGDNTRATELLNLAITARPDRVPVLDGLGQLAHRSGNYAKALEYYNYALSLAPGSASILLHRGETYTLTGRIDEAESELKTALALDDSPGIWRQLGRVQASMGRYDDAFASFLHVGDLAYAYNEVGEAAMRKSELRVAERFLQNAIQASPTYHEQAHKNLARVGEQLRPKSTQRGS